MTRCKVCEHKDRELIESLMIQGYNSNVILKKLAEKGIDIAHHTIENHRNNHFKLSDKEDDSTPRLFLSINQVALLLDVTTRTIKNYADSGNILTSSNGKQNDYDVISALLYKISLLEEKITQLDLKSKEKSSYQRIQDAKLKKAELEAERLEFLLGVEKGKYVIADEIGKAWDKIILTIKYKLLALPNNLSPQLINRDDPNKIYVILEKYVYEILEVLSDPRCYYNDNDDTEDDSDE